MTSSAQLYIATDHVLGLFDQREAHALGRPEKSIINEMVLHFFILYLRRVLHPAPSGAWAQNTSQIAILVPFSKQAMLSFVVYWPALPRRTRLRDFPTIDQGVL